MYNVTDDGNIIIITIIDFSIRIHLFHDDRAPRFPQDAFTARTFSMFPSLQVARDARRILNRIKNRTNYTVCGVGDEGIIIIIVVVPPRARITCFTRFTMI